MLCFFVEFMISLILLLTIFHLQGELSTQINFLIIKVFRVLIWVSILVFHWMSSHRQTLNLFGCWFFKAIIDRTFSFLMCSQQIGHFYHHFSYILPRFVKATKFFLLRTISFTVRASFWLTYQICQATKIVSHFIVRELV